MEGCRNNTPKVLSVGCCEQPVLFHKVTIPASAGDETTDPPLPGKYRNVLLVYEASGNAYLYSSDGMPTLILDKEDIRRLEEMIREEEAERKEEDEKLATAIEDEAKARKDADDALDDAILDEIDARIEADEDIWTEIETIEAASDVVDIVGTYAELQQYDTSHLNDNDIIKVLQDETHDGAITYWRWNKHDQEFSYVGEQGPYYTQDQIDNLLDDKQDTLTAGNNIQINDNVISATDTTYTAGNGLLLSNDEFSVDTSVIAEKSDIPTVNDATLTITQGGSTIGTFTANSSTDTTINIAAASYSAGTGIDITNDTISVDNTVAMVSDLPTKTSDLTNDGSDGTSTYVEADELATVATTGSYTDLTNTPTIPTVNDATLTITQNGTSAGTFTANASNNTTIALTDTTYTAGTGIAINANNVISSTVTDTTTLYVDSSSSEYRFYYDAAKTELVTYQEMAQLLEGQNIRLVWGNNSVAGVTAYSIWAGGIYIFSYDSGMYRSYRWFSSDQYASLTAHYLQDQLIAGSNISISGRTISATDTTYTAGTGLSLTGTEFAVDTTVIAEKSDIPTQTSDLTNNGSDGTSAYVEADELATVATSGSYNDLSNKPTIPAAQVNSDWNASSGVAEILNKPTLAAVATSGAYSDLTGTPTIPTVNDATLTVTQNGTTAGTFTANASSNTTIALTDTTYSAFTGTDGQTAGTAGLVPAPATTDAGKFLKADGTWSTAGGGTLYSTTGQNTNGAMTQKATSDMVFVPGKDPTTSSSDVRIAIGNGNTSGDVDSVSIGRSADVAGAYAIAIGFAANAPYAGVSIGGFTYSGNGYSVTIGDHANDTGTGSVLLGYHSLVDNYADYSVALGAYSVADTSYTVSVGSGNSSHSATYQYRRVVNVADAVNAHDAVTKGQLDTVAGTIPTTNNISSNDWSALWQ